MLGIGDFARHGRVSVRMLRHYDAINLLQPARVDPHTGYRWYHAAQLSELNRIVALKHLGFTLEEIATIQAEKLNADELRGMLTLRHAQLRQQIAEDSGRLAHVEARLRLIEREGAMPTEDVLVKPVPPTRVAELRAVAESFAPEAISPVIEPLYAELRGLLTRLDLKTVGPGLAWYEAGPDEAVVVHAAAPVAADGSRREGQPDIVDLPEIPRAATILHHGPMADVMSTLQQLAVWVDAHGYRSLGYHREVYLEYGCGEDPSAWVTELQEPVAER